MKFKGKLLLAYTAGIVDGEGSIGIYSHKNKSKRGYTYDLIVTVGNTNLWLIEWLRMNFGGSIVPMNSMWSSIHPKKRQQWKWALYHKQAADFLGLILPYLNIKRPQAELAISFQKKKHEYLKTDANTVLLEAERLLMAKMNAKGPK